MLLLQLQFYYNLNYVDIQSELNEFNRDEKGSMKNNTFSKNDDERNVLLYLTNNKAFNMTNQYISKFNLINKSFKVNLDICYRHKATWYDKNENKMDKHKEK